MPGPSAWHAANERTIEVRTRAACGHGHSFGRALALTCVRRVHQLALIAEAHWRHFDPLEILAPEVAIADTSIPLGAGLARNSLDEDQQPRADVEHSIAHALCGLVPIGGPAVAPRRLAGLVDQVRSKEVPVGAKHPCDRLPAVNGLRFAN